MNNTKIQKTLVSKLAALFAIGAAVSLLFVSNVFAAAKELNTFKTNQAIAITAENASNVEKVLTAWNKVDDTVKVADLKDHVTVTLNDAKTKVTVKAKDNDTVVAGSVELDIKAPTFNWFSWYMILLYVAVVAAIAGGVFYFVQKKRRA
ncbi:Immunodominant membrane protein precursor, fragment [Candidatus Phytoplasma australiense]|uniref:Immunodominant membrane protein n=1 Tax=Phytoplasma australiense TaxID=59748 RepID=B1VAX3_PHYAS|nr:Immunodominant membrane protein precursor, fragment [Candidatus Phytoplasma australiense]